jgi:hypothetical protein
VVTATPGKSGGLSITLGVDMMTEERDVRDRGRREPCGGEARCAAEYDWESIENPREVLWRRATVWIWFGG